MTTKNIKIAKKEVMFISFRKMFELMWPKLLIKLFDNLPRRNF